MTGTRRGRDGDVTGCGGERPAPPCRGPPSPASPRDSAAPFRAATSSSRPRHVPVTSPPRHVISPPRTAAVPVQFRNGLRRQAFRAPVTPPSHPVTSPLITIHFESRPRHGGGGHPVCHFARGRHGVVPVHEILLRRPAGTRAMGGGPLVHGTNDTSCMPSRLRSKRRGLAGKILAPPMALSAWELRPPSAMTWGLKFRTPRIMV